MVHLLRKVAQSKKMLNRVFTGIILALFFLLLLVYGSGLILASLFSLIAIYAYYEWLIICKSSNKDIFILITLLLTTMIAFLLLYTHAVIIFLAYISIFAWLIILFDLLLTLNVYKKILQVSSKFIGLIFIFITWTLFISLGQTGNSNIFSHNYLLFSNHESVYMSQYYLFIIGLVSLTDMSGYFFGKIFGRIKLCPVISPNKTLEGFIASLLIPMVTFYIFFTYIIPVPILILDIFYLLLICIFCTVGDLFVSVYKRYHQVKDSGNILPGHGGIMDRLDSYLPTIAILHIWLFL